MRNEIKQFDHQTEKFTFVFSGWRGLRVKVDPDEAHSFVDIRKACHVGCGKCGFPADYPLHQKAA